MNEIEKMYKLAEVGILGTVDLREMKILVNDEVFVEGKNLPNNYYDIYPPFTVEKQFELLKICFDKCGVIGKERDVDDCMLYIPPEDYEQAIVVTDYIPAGTWEESIAGLVNFLWQDLTEEEKQQIKEILE